MNKILCTIFSASMFLYVTDGNSMRRIYQDPFKTKTVEQKPVKTLEQTIAEMMKKYPPLDSIVENESELLQLIETDVAKFIERMASTEKGVLMKMSKNVVSALANKLKQADGRTNVSLVLNSFNIGTLRAEDRRLICAYILYANGEAKIISDAYRSSSQVVQTEYQKDMDTATVAPDNAIDRDLQVNKKWANNKTRDEMKKKNALQENRKKLEEAKRASQQPNAKTAAQKGGFSVDKLKEGIAASHTRRHKFPTADAS